MIWSATPRIPGKVPAYSLHKASGQAVVRLDLVDHYPGPYGSPESHERYPRAVSQWSASQTAAQGMGSWSPSGLTVKQLCALYWQFAKTYYVEDQPTQGDVTVRQPMKLLPCGRWLALGDLHLGFTQLANDLLRGTLLPAWHRLTSFDCVLTTGFSLQSWTRSKRAGQIAVYQQLQKIWYAV